MTSGIYIHIPFCKQSCSYCDFHFSTSLKSREALVDALIKEIKLQKNYLSINISLREEIVIKTIYFGGGTPSLLSATELERIFSALYKHFNISSDAEITLEANPDDLDKKKLEELRSLPVNRLSIGIQSFFENDLKLMNRAHNNVQAENSILNSMDAGFKNISIDLIYGTPGLSNENWKKNLEKVFYFGVPHISAYCLTVEEKTPLQSHIRKGKVKPVNEEQSVEQFFILMEEMEKHGYEQYEISNFCKPGFHSRHNSNYWTGEKYLGIGPSAHSFNGESRQWNVSNNFRYIKAIAEEKIPCEIEMLTTEQKFNEFVMTGLRTAAGIDLEKVKINFGDDFVFSLQDAAKPYIQSSKIIHSGNNFALSKQGKLIADKITYELFAPF